ncbi:hypothetical protein [Pseudanabaena sp. PCC 6802]|uniref:hypothetical protein n=1 Tax=Pseudanabaena sp. PCC 6802 TaxID=118173 RepID=UPI00034DAE2B|nr:hypothetical protein [Pseudanabaena sp. PCC 6802]
MNSVINNDNDDSAHSQPQADGKRRIKVDKEAVTEAIEKLTAAIADAAANNIKQGLFHLPDTMHDALWVATDLVEKSRKFPNYKLTFYHKGMGEGSNTCAVTFIDNTDSPK